MRRGSQVRGELITKTRPLVKGYFGFRSGKDEDDVDHNRDIVEHLKFKYGYMYAVCTVRFVYSPLRTAADSAMLQDSDEHVGLCESRLVQEIINAMWFVNRFDEGVTESNFFKPLQAVTIALVFTAVWICSVFFERLRLLTMLLPADRALYRRVFDGLSTRCWFQ